MFEFVVSLFVDRLLLSVIAIVLGRSFSTAHQIQTDVSALDELRDNLTEAADSFECSRKLRVPVKHKSRRRHELIIEVDLDLVYVTFLYICTERLRNGNCLAVRPVLLL